MDVAEASDQRAAARPPLAVAWVLLVASAATVLVIGLSATALILGSLPLQPVPRRFWIALFFACAATIASLGVRSVRWIFLLRRAGIRIPIRDAYIGYFAGLSLLFVPLLAGEIAMRAFVLRARARVPSATVVIVNVWERLVDLVALATIAGVLTPIARSHATWTASLLTLPAAMGIPTLRTKAVGILTALAERASARWHIEPAPDTARLAGGRTWWGALAASILAWLLPALGLWALVAAWRWPYGPVQAAYDYASASSAAALTLAPGGILVAGARLLSALEAQGLIASSAALTVFAFRLATIGVATVLGAVVFAVHRRSANSPTLDASSHFDSIAGEYDVQIPEPRRKALLARKTGMMRDAIDRFGIGRRGLDVGCGQGWHLAEMRNLGFDVSGLDDSAAQVHMAESRMAQPGLVRHGSVLQIPADDESFDFAYIINVLHHLSSVDEQRAAFAELFRVLRPGGLLFVHEINTRNILFRFYMGYVFPSLNCIDEGVERWLLPHRLRQYSDAPAVDIRYFTFLPDFLPDRFVRILQRPERLLEQSPFRMYSAHYMAVLRKP